MWFLSFVFLVVVLLRDDHKAAALLPRFPLGPQSDDHAGGIKEAQVMLVAVDNRATEIRLG
jgi:hypothetical protein